MRLIWMGLIAMWCSVATASPLVTPTMHIASGQVQDIALTFDACDGRTDTRILSALVENQVPATIFVTGKWLRRNAAAVAVLKAHPELFEVENHGLRHLVPVDTPRSVYGQRAAGRINAIRAEVIGGGDAIIAAGLPASHWYRGATAEYSASAIAAIRGLGYRVAGFSLNADQGASLGARAVEQRMAHAQNGDVVIAHINQPKRASGLGVVKGIADLKARNVRFVKLSQVAEQGDDGVTN